MNRLSKTRVILADDHNLVRSGMAALLLQHGGFDVVAEAADGLAALDQICEHTFDLLIIDLAMPRLGGIAVIEELRRHKKSIKILVLSMYDDAQFVARAMQNGANGYLLKQAMDEDLFHAIDEVMAGNRFISDSIDREALTEFTFDDADLTTREKEVLQLIGEGMTNPQIAEMLFISPHTAIRHRANLMRKLNVHNRVELVKVASSRGLILIPKGGEL
jgi:DNA-binding NarL/FixJ family response regulator